jgi:hypothetical protein
VCYFILNWCNTALLQREEKRSMGGRQGREYRETRKVPVHGIVNFDAAAMGHIIGGEDGVLSTTKNLSTIKDIYRARAKEGGQKKKRGGIRSSCRGFQTFHQPRTDRCSFRELSRSNHQVQSHSMHYTENPLIFLFAKKKKKNKKKKRGGGGGGKKWCFLL